MATTITCRKCGRDITSARSIREATQNGGYGRGCARKIADAALASDQPAEQVDKALELIEDGALVHWTRDLFQAVSTDGTEVYTIDAAAGSCTCPAGQHGRTCYHAVAVALVLGQPVTAPAPVELARAADPFACFPVDDDPFAAAA